MPTSVQLRRDIDHLVGQMDRDIGIILWSVEPEEAVNLLGPVLRPLVGEYGLMAAAVAAAWYDEVREQRKVKGRFRAVSADIPETGTAALLDWITGKTDDGEVFRSALAGGLQRRVANFARQTVMGSSIRDPKGRGWRRTGVGDGCEFCVMLISRGAVYTEGSSDFVSHDRCRCGAEPVFF